MRRSVSARATLGTRFFLLTWSKVSSWVDGKASLSADGDRDPEKYEQDGQWNGRSYQGWLSEGKDATNEHGGAEELIIEGGSS